MKSMRTLLLLLAALPLAACNCGEGPLGKMPDPNPSALLDAGSVPLDGGGTPKLERVIHFAGNDPFVVFLGTTPDLLFTLQTLGGAAVPNTTMTFTYQGTGGTVSAMSGVTDSAGQVFLKFIGDTVGGTGTLTASADLAAPLPIQIQVIENPNDHLIVDVTSAARIPITTANALIYTGEQAAVPTCAQLLAATVLPTASITANYPSVPGSQSFANQMSGQYVTAIATGKSASGAVVAKGCSEGNRISGLADTHVVIRLDQNPPNLEGSYDVLLGLDLGNTIPPPIGPVVVLVTDVLSDPAGWAVYQVLAVVDDNLGTNFVEWMPPGGTMTVRASFDDVKANPNSFPVWVAARNAFDNFLRQQFGQPYITVTEIGGDIAHLIRSFDVGAGYTITSTGTPNRVKVFEDWQAMVFQWRYGCPNGDLGCARRPIVFTGPNARLAPTTATYGATVRYTPSTNPAESERYTLDLDAHRIDIRYGAIVLVVLDDLVFPNLPPPLNGNNLTEVINHIVDCGSLANSISNSTGIPAPVIQALCTTAVSAAATYVENQILTLDSMNNPGLISGLGPNGGGHIVLVDRDLDNETETVESMMTYLSWTTSMSVTTPIMGSGRRRASHCHSDYGCTAPLVCTPIGSYLKIRAVENDCRPHVGSEAGMVTCNQNSDCASNLCFDPGTHNRICFAACYGAGSCGRGTCTSSAAAVNLDGVLMGLGSARDDACVP